MIRLLSALTFLALPWMHAPAFAIQEAGAQKQFKADTNGTLKFMKADIKITLKAFKADVAEYIKDIKADRKDPANADVNVASIFEDAYRRIRDAVQDAFIDVDQDGSALLFEVGTENLKGFHVGDGGTLDLFLAKVELELVKFNKQAVVKLKSIRAAVEAKGKKDVSFTGKVNPLTMGPPPDPARELGGALQGGLSTQIYFAFGVYDRRPSEPVSRITCGGVAPVGTTLMADFRDGAGTPAYNNPDVDFDVTFPQIWRVTTDNLMSGGNFQFNISEVTMPSGDDAAPIGDTIGVRGLPTE